MDYFDSTVVYVNSKFKTSGDDSNFYYSFRDLINQQNNFDYVTLLSFAATKSYYLINNDNNKFIVNENGIITTIVIPIGNYSFSSMVTQLNTLLNASLSYTYVVTSDFSTAKIIFTVSNNAGIQPIFIFDNTTPYNILGFVVDVSYPFVANTLSCPLVVNFQLCNSLVLNTDMCKNNLLSLIVPDAVDNSLILFSSQQPGFGAIKMTRQLRDSAHFWILNGRTNEKIDFNGIPVVFSLVFYRRNDYFNLATTRLIADTMVEAVNNDQTGSD